MLLMAMLLNHGSSSNVWEWLRGSFEVVSTAIFCVILCYKGSMVIVFLVLLYKKLMGMVKQAIVAIIRKAQKVEPTSLIPPPLAM